jgi:D-sedoheptulose 7-phosphate isomerase
MSEESDMRASIQRHLASLETIADGADTIDQIARALHGALMAGGKIMTCGNGGSAAEALHLAEEMIGRFSRDRAPMAALSLCADPAAMTCIVNDYGREELFARQVKGLGRAGDVLVVLSTSGRSANIVRALQQARELDITTIGLLGRPGSPAEALCDISLTLRIPDSSHVQEVHLVAIHLILEYLDARS